jgi:NADPH:quinone reductase-like Zn-dependent oxidoreductase
MRVVELQRYGGPEELRLAERRRPDPLPTEVRVAVQAAAVNRVDLKTRAGQGMAAVLGEPPIVLGWDVAGIVEAIGSGVTRFREGDEVFGMPWFPRQAGCYAEAVVAPSRQFALKPAELSFVEAAALPLSSLTAWQCLVDTADVQPGQRVLVIGAAGGVGALVVQIAKCRDAHVIGVARQSDADYLGELGIDELVDYTEGPFEEEIDDVDVVIDLVGGDYPLRCLEVIRPGGMLVAPAHLPDGLAAIAAERNVQATDFLVEPDGAALDDVASLVEEGTLVVNVAAVFPLAAAGDAQRRVEQGGRGKVVLEVG